jgi:xanthine dehydrogenase accessory factor
MSPDDGGARPVSPEHSAGGAPPSPSTYGSGEDVLAAALRWRSEGRRAALATVLRTWGSSPRQPGSQLAVNDQRAFVGSVSGGCVEGAVIHEALEVMASGQPRTLDFGVSDEDAWAVGLACGGKVQVYVDPVGDAEERLLAELLAGGERRGHVLATRLGSREHVLLAMEDGVLRPREGDADPELLEASRGALTRDRSEVVETPGGEVFLQVYNPPLRMVVVGAVHIAQALCPMAAIAGFAVTVVDPRTAFATPERFPGVTLSTDWPDRALEALAPDHRSAVVTLTHDPKLDEPALAVALRSGAFYIGALGSTRTQAARLGRMRGLGFDDATLARIHGPVGLDIGARSAAEIAVSILAQIVERLRRQPS